MNTLTGAVTEEKEKVEVEITVQQASLSSGTDWLSGMEQET